MFSLDHLVISATDLAEGATATESALGVPLAPGGRHAHFATHNRLLGFGDCYLEVIAVDPDAPNPGRPRWFGLDAFAGAPRLTTWVLACDDLDAALGRMGTGFGAPVDLARGDLRWRMAVPDDGVLPWDGLAPALIQWITPPPIAGLESHGCRLTALRVSHPDPRLAAALEGVFDDSRVALGTGPASIAADIATPAGPRALP
ncbi:MAG: VOC family protein [Shimia sp.]